MAQDPAGLLMLATRLADSLSRGVAVDVCDVGGAARTVCATASTVPDRVRIILLVAPGERRATTRAERTGQWRLRQPELGAIEDSESRRPLIGPPPGSHNWSSDGCAE